MRNPIDAFVLAGLEARGLQPTPPADKATLLRRVTFDLIGLPPTPDEIDAFLKDDSPDAYEKVVDRLLASPHYGERWGRHWLDVARFSESQGFEYDRIRDNAWRYRDYVIQAFNDDKPYPQFVKEQIAGDVLPPGADAPGSPQTAIVATGFLTAGPWDEAGNGSVSTLLKARIREEELEDMLSTVGQTFMGLTVNCARCHDHKFDPIKQTDYYRLKAVFEGVRYGNRPLLTPEESRRRDEEIARTNKRIDEIAGRLAVLEQAGRDKALHDRRRRRRRRGCRSRWRGGRSSVDAKDVIGGLHGTLMGGAVVENGRLKLNGKGAFLQTAPLAHDLREKTLEAWVSPANLTQRGGGVLSVETKDGRTLRRHRLRRARGRAGGWPAAISTTAPATSKAGRNRQAGRAGPRRRRLRRRRLHRRLPQRRALRPALHSAGGRIDAANLPGRRFARPARPAPHRGGQRLLRRRGRGGPAL